MFTGSSGGGRETESITEYPEHREPEGRKQVPDLGDSGPIFFSVLCVLYVLCG
jgi:hypothetical protein